MGNKESIAGAQELKEHVDQKKKKSKSDKGEP